MKEYNNIRVYSNDKTVSGNKVQVERSLYSYDDDISDFLDKSKNEVEASLELALKNESRAYEALQKTADDWSVAATEVAHLQNVLKYMNTPEVKHTKNEWKPLHFEFSAITGEEISNRVYRMYIRTEEHTPFRCNEATEWRVTWDFQVWNYNDPSGQGWGYGETIAGQENKKFDSKEAAEKYIEGRKKAYAQYFSEICPPVPKEYSKYFTVCGTLLPGYSVETEEKELDGKTDKATVEKRKKHRDRGDER